MKTNYPRNDIKFYYWIHVNRQVAMGKSFVSYPQFYRRLRDWMLLHDAIYTPRAESQVRKKRQPKVEDNIRRSQTLKSENVQIIDLDTLRELECKPIENVLQDNPTLMVNKYNFKPKPSLRIRFISFLKKRCK